MKAATPHSNFKKQFRTLGMLLLLIILVMCFRQNPNWVERYYSGGVYPLLCRVLHPLMHIFPFSIGDILYCFVIIWLVWGVFNLLRSLIIKQFIRAGYLILRFFISLSVAWLWFYTFWGLNYYRPPAAKLLALDDTSYTIKDAARVTALLIDSANACRATLNTVQMQQSNQQIYQNAVTAINKLAATNQKFKAIAPRIKPSVFSYWLNYMGTSGYYNPFTSEAQLNYQMPVFDKPFVACHEMGHQTGFAREDEANFAGFAAGVNADDCLLRYSAYYAGLEEFMRYLRFRDTSAHHTLRRRISPLVYQDLRADSAYWTKYEGKAEVMSGIFFDKFLKANNQPRGLRTYNRMILLTMAYYRKMYGVW